MKKILLFLLVLVLAAAGVGIYLWNKPPETVDGKDAVAVTAEALAAAYTSDEQKANAAYLERVLEVSGTVTEVTRNQDGKTVVLLGVSDPLSGVQCTLREDNVAITPGRTVSIKGFCNGYTMVVLLSDCIIK